MRKITILILFIGITSIAFSLSISSQYFNINYEKADNYYAKRVVSVIDRQYLRINSDMGITPEGKVDLFITRTKDEFNKFYGNKAPDQIVAFARTRPYPIIVVKSPHIAPGMDLETVLAHELSHLVLNNYLGSREIPRWLSEGFAMYESKELRINHYATVASAAIRGDLIELKNLDYAFYAEGSNLDLAYAQSYYLMSYIIGKFGPAKFRKLIDKASLGKPIDLAISDSLSVEFDLFEKNFKKSINERYFLASVIAYSSPVWIMVILAILGFWLMQQRNKRIKLKWQIEEMFEGEDEV